MAATIAVRGAWVVPVAASFACIGLQMPYLLWWADRVAQQLGYITALILVPSAVYCGGVVVAERLVLRRSASAVWTIALAPIQTVPTLYYVIRVQWMGCP